MYSKNGYKRNSKDKNNPFNIIPSGNITMEDVDFPIFAMDDLGNSEIMMPGANYTFPGNQVLEVPLYNLDRARNLNSPEKAPDDYNMLVENKPHWGSVDPESGDWLKSMDHPTAWMEYMDYVLNPRSLNTDLVVDPLGYFGDRQLKYIPKTQNGNEISLELLLRQAMAESSLDPNAVSKAGAKGLTQIMENALTDYQDATGDMNIDLFNPEDAKKVQTWYMNNLYNADFINKPNQSDTVRMAKTLASYNWGRGNLYNLLTEQKNKGVDIYSDDMDWIQYLPSETNEYLNKILFDTNEDFKSDTEKYYSDEKYAPYIDLYKEQGGDLPKAQLGLPRVLKGIRNMFKSGKNIIENIPNTYKGPTVSSFQKDLSFKSEINWSNWNKDIPLNKELMQEYNTIEEVAKKKGTWMKNADGTDFEGPPELFVQMQSGAFKKAYPEGITTTYRGFPKGEGPISWGKKYGDDYGAGRIINPMNVEYTSVFTGDKNLASHYGPNIFKLGSRNTPIKSLTLDAFGSDWSNMTYALRDKKALQTSLDANKKRLLKAEEGIKAGKQGNIYNKDFVTNAKKNIKSYENILNNWDEITSNPAYKQLMDFAAGKQSLYTDDLAEFVQKYNLDNLFVKNIDDGVLGDILISNQVPGNFLKSLEGNVGTFDLTNPNIYKEEGGDLSKAQVGTAIRKGLQALKNFRKSPEITDDLVNRLSQSNEFKVIDSQIPNANQTKTIVNDVVDKPYIDINTVKTIEQRAVDFIEKEIIKKADNLPKGITLDQVNHVTGEIIISSKKRKPFTYKLNKTEQKRLTDFFFKQADKEGLFKPKLQSSRQMAIDMDWFYNPATKRMETRGSFLGLSGYTPDLLPDGRNFVKFLDELDQKYINRGNTINPNPAKEEFYLGIDRKVADRFLNTLEKFGVNTITGKQLKTVFPEGFYHGSSERINKLSDITLQPIKNVKSGDKTMSGFYGTSNPQYAASYMDWTKEIGSSRDWTKTPWGVKDPMRMYGPAKNRTLHSIDVSDDAVVGFTDRQIQGGYKSFEDLKDKGVDIILGKASIGNRVMNHNEILFLNKKGIKNFNPIEPSTSILGQGTKIDDLINLDPTAYKLMMSGKMDEGKTILDKYYMSYGKSPLGPTVELPGGINAIEGGVGMTPVGGYGWNLKDIPKLDLMLDTRYGPKIKLPNRFNPDLDQYFRISREGPLWKEGGDLPKAQSGLFKIPKAIAKYFGKTVDDIPVSGKVVNKIDVDNLKTFTGETGPSSFSIAENPNKLSIDNIEGDLIRRDKGKYLTFDESGNLISSARSTHFTGTGAPVETHFMGNWDDAVTTINLPLKDAIKFNPGQIRTSAIGDTYFYDKFNYPKSANIFTGDYQLFNQLKKSGYNAELSKESMDLFRQMNTLKPKILNETATAAEKELFEKLAKQNADIHNQFLKSSNLKAVNPKDPNIPLGWEKFNPYKTEQRSIRSDALSPYVHFEQFPDYNIQALDRKFEKGMFDKMYPDHIIQPSPYRVKNIPTSSDLKIFQKEVLEGWTDDYAKGWLETYSKKGYDTPFGDLMKNIVEEKLNKNLPYLQYYHGGSLPKFQGAGEYDDDGYKTVTYGANKKKYQDTGTWSEYEPYETYGGKTWRKRTYELSRDDLRYLEHKKSFLTDVDYRSGINNSPKNLTQFIRNSNKPWRVQEIIKDNGATQYVLQYPTATGSFRTFALGDADSGLANLNPEYVQELKKTGKTGISGFSSWFDMTPQERKDYGYSEWFDKGFTRDLKVDQDGNTKSGWEHYGSSTPLSYRLSDVEIRRLPSSIVQKYNLVGNDKMTLDPNTGEIDFLTSSGGLRKVVSQKDMKWFQNPGRLKELATDSRFNYKEDNVLDYLNNPDFRYFADSEKVTLDPVKLDGVPTENDMSLEKPKPYESTITLEPKTLDQIDIEKEDEIIKRRPYEAPINLDPVEFKGFPDKEQDIIRSNPYESVITLDKKEIEKIPVDDGSLIERRIQETPITLDPINVTGIDSDGTATTDGSKQRFVPKSDIEADMPEIVLTPGMEEERDKAKTIEDIMGNFQDIKGTTKYVNKSAKAILDAINRDDYNEKDLSRDLGIFEKYYGQENLGYLQDMLDKSQGPKANKGVEVLEDGKFNVKMDRLNSIIDKYYAGEQLSAAENEEIKLYDLRSNDKIDIQPEENNKTDLLVDNKSYNLADQIYIYNQYLDDAFTSDDEEKSGNKIVDKINRVYYNQAKQKDMHVYDLLLAMQNEMRQ